MQLGRRDGAHTVRGATSARAHVWSTVGSPRVRCYLNPNRHFANHFAVEPNMSSIIYYKNLDYDQLPTHKPGRKKARIEPVTPSYARESDCITIVTASPPDSAYGSATSQRSAPLHELPQQNQLSSWQAKAPPRSKTATKVSSHPKEVHGFESAATFITSHSNSSAWPESRAREPAPAHTRNFRPNGPIVTRVSKQVLLDNLERYFKFTSFRQNQLEAVEATCLGLDTLVLMPTGGGKSICYQLPAIVSPGISVVVSPLKSLIDDQVNRLKSLNIKTSALIGETSERDASDIYQDLKSGDPELKLLYVTPEKINQSAALISIFKQLYKRNLLTRFVIDEAHCVSMWGSDFRPDYRRLGVLRDQFPDVPIMALTATAPPKVRDDIYRQLQMNKDTGKTFIQSFNRPNLKFEVRPKAKDCTGEICSLIMNQFRSQCGIIYCLSRNDCERLAERLREKGIYSSPYHAGLSDIQRRRVFQAWSDGTFQVVCATIAFGMGIDKSDVRFVIHYSMPKSVEGYYQEAGRAGRDGKFASCILYYSKLDLFRMKGMLSKGYGRTNEDKERDRANLEHVLKYVDNKKECRRAILLRYLGEEFDSNDCISHIRTACDNCLDPK